MKKVIITILVTLPLLMFSCGSDEPTLPPDPDNPPGNVDPTPEPDVPDEPDEPKNDYEIPGNDEIIYIAGQFSSWEKDDRYKLTFQSENSEIIRFAGSFTLNDELFFVIHTKHGRIGCKNLEESGNYQDATKPIFSNVSVEYEAAWENQNENNAPYPFGCPNWMRGDIQCSVTFNKISKGITVELASGDQPPADGIFFLEGEFNDWDKGENLYSLTNSKYRPNQNNKEALEGTYFIPKGKMSFLIRNRNARYYAGGKDETITFFDLSDRKETYLWPINRGSKYENLLWPGGFATFRFFPQFGQIYIKPDYNHPIYVCGSFNNFNTGHGTTSKYGTLYKVTSKNGNIYKGEIDVKTNDIELNFYTVPGYDVKVGRIGSMKSKQTKPIDMKMIVYQYESVVLDGQGTWKISNWGEPGKMYIRLDMDKMQVIFSRTPINF